MSLEALALEVLEDLPVGVKDALVEECREIASQDLPRGTPWSANCARRE
jgi:hypothetical protein